MHLYSEEEWSGHSVRIHRSTAHKRRHGRAQGKVVGYILFEAKAQQSQKTTRFRVSRLRHSPSYNP